MDYMKIYMHDGCHINEEGVKHYYLNDKLHREDGPAIEYPDDSPWWFINDEYRPNDDMPNESIINSKFWYLNGQRINPEEAINDSNLKQKYPELIASILIHLVHES